jgi:hypothetical protein
MNLLFAFLVPVAYVYYTVGRKGVDRLPEHVSCGVGALAGTCAIFVDRLISSLVSLPTAHFFLKWALFFLSDSIIPLSIGLIPLFFLSVAPFRSRLSLLKPQLFGVFSVYLPYKLFVFYDLNDMWAMIIIPVLFISLIFFSVFMIDRLLAKVSGNPDWIDLSRYLGSCVLAFLLSDLSKTLWFYNFPFWTYIPVSFAIIGTVVYLRIRPYKL